MSAEIIEKQGKAMQLAGLDALIALSPENVTYTAGLVVPSQSLMRWRHAGCIVTAGGQLSMIVIDMEETTVKKLAAIEKVRVYREFVDDPMDTLADLLTELKLDRARIGIEMDFIPARDFQTLARRLPQARFTAAQNLFHRLREIKTAAEIELLRKLSKLTDNAIGNTLKQARAGMTEMDLAGVLTSGIFAGGAENFKLMIVASGERSQYPNVGPTRRALKEGDLIRMEIFGILTGIMQGSAARRLSAARRPSKKRSGRI